MHPALSRGYPMGSDICTRWGRIRGGPASSPLLASASVGRLSFLMRLLSADASLRGWGRVRRSFGSFTFGRYCDETENSA